MTHFLRLAQGDPEAAVRFLGGPHTADAALGIGQACATQNERSLFSKLGAVSRLRSALAECDNNRDPTLVAAIFFSLYRLCTNADENALAVQMDYPVILVCLRAFSEAANVQSCGLFLLSALMTTSRRSVLTFAPQSTVVMEITVKALDAHNALDVIVAACRVIAASRTFFDGVGAAEPIEAIHRVLQKNDLPEVFVEVSDCLRTLAFDMRDRTIMSRVGIWDVLRFRMETMPVEAREHGLAAIEMYEKRQRQVPPVMQPIQTTIPHVDENDAIPHLLEQIGAECTAAKRVELLTRLGDLAARSTLRHVVEQRNGLPLLLDILSVNVEKRHSALVIAASYAVRMLLRNQEDQLGELATQSGPLLVAALDVFVQEPPALRALLELIRASIPALSFTDLPMFLGQRILNVMTIHARHAPLVVLCMACLELLVLSCRSQPRRWGKRCIEAMRIHYDNKEVKKQAVMVLGAIQRVHGSDCILHCGGLTALADVSSRRAHDILARACADSAACKSAVRHILERTSVELTAVERLVPHLPLRGDLVVTVNKAEALADVHSFVGRTTFARLVVGPQNREMVLETPAVSGDAPSWTEHPLKTHVDWKDPPRNEGAFFTVEVWDEASWLMGGNTYLGEARVVLEEAKDTHVSKPLHNNDLLNNGADAKVIGTLHLQYTFTPQIEGNVDEVKSD